MKNSEWCLWLNGKRIFNIRQLREEFDTAAVIGYYYGGSLTAWLESAGENTVLERILSINDITEIGKQLEFAFGVSPAKKPSAISEGHKRDFTPFLASQQTLRPSGTIDFSPAAASSFHGIPSSFPGLSGAEKSVSPASSWSAGIAAGSFRTGSAALYLSSFFSAAGSFSAGSSAMYGAFSSSFAASSGITGSGLIASLFLGSFGSFGSLERFSEGGSYVYKAGNVTVTEEEYKRTLINLSSCPLNAYGYGINLV